MSTVMQFLQTTFGPLVLIFTVSNLAAMGLQVRVPEVAVALRNKKSLALIFVWGWVLGPAVDRVLGLLQAELKLVMGQCGTRTVADITPDYVATPDWKA